MAITAKYFGQFWKSALNKEVDLDSDVIKLSLHTASMSPNQDTWRYKSDLTNECSGSGYTAGGATLTGMSVDYNAATNVLSFSANDVTWTNITLIGAQAPVYAVLYDASPGSDAARPLIGYIDLGGPDYAPNGGNLTFQWDGSGIGAVTVA